MPTPDFYKGISKVVGRCRAGIENNLQSRAYIFMINKRTITSIPWMLVIACQEIHGFLELPFAVLPDHIGG